MKEHTCRCIICVKPDHMVKIQDIGLLRTFESRTVDFNPKSYTLPSEPLRSYKDTLVAMPERKQTKCLSKGVYLQNVLTKCHWRPYYEIQVYHDTLPCATLKNESMHARETLYLLAKHHIRVPLECHTVWLQFTFQVRSLLA